MDFPGCGDSTESFAENNLSNMLADLKAARDFAVGRAAVDPDRIGYVGGDAAPELAQMPSGPLEALVRDEFSDLLGARGEPVVARVRHWPRGLPLDQARNTAARVPSAISTRRSEPLITRRISR